MFDVDGHHTNKVWMTSCLDSSARLDSDSGDKSRSLSVVADLNVTRTGGREMRALQLSQRRKGKKKNIT
jgi:hypothetical protein